MQGQQTSNFPPNTEAFAYRFNMRYKHRAYPNEGMCRIEMCKSNGDVLIVATELKDNPGPSIINAAEAIHEKLAKAYGLTPENSTFVTLFDKGSYRGGLDKPSYTTVHLHVKSDGRYDSAKFQHIQEVSVLEMIAYYRENGAPLEITEIEDEVL